MEQTDQRERAVQSIEADPDIRTLLTAPPQATLMPFAKEHSRFYLVVVLFVAERALNLEMLRFICSKAIELLINGAVLRGLGGVEILPCILGSGSTKRVMRLSVLSESLSAALSLTAEQLRQSVPSEGITSHFYMKEVKDQA